MSPFDTLYHLAREAEQLGALFPASHQIRNEVTAVRLLEKTFPHPTSQEVDMALDCLDRINVAIVIANEKPGPTIPRKLKPRFEFDRPMSELILETIGVHLPATHRKVMLQELKDGGCSAGMVYLGFIKAVPDMVYILWHHAGEMPVTKMLPRELFASTQSAREAAKDFLLQWNQRNG